jgi:hypothetical protein
MFYSAPITVLPHNNTFVSGMKEKARFTYKHNKERMRASK